MKLTKAGVKVIKALNGGRSVEELMLITGLSRGQIGIPLGALNRLGYLEMRNGNPHGLLFSLKESSG